MTPGPESYQQRTEEDEKRCNRRIHPVPVYLGPKG